MTVVMAIGSSAIARHPWVIPIAACDLHTCRMGMSNLGVAIEESPIGAGESCLMLFARLMTKPQLRKGLRRWWNRVIGMPTRLLMRIMSRREPQQDYRGIRLLVADYWLVPHAERFFERTREALLEAASRAPQAYAEFDSDVQQVLLWGEAGAPPYNRFQLAAVVPPGIALEADTVCYAAWLLHTSGLLYGQDEAQVRAQALLTSLAPDERSQVAKWLTSVTEVEPP